MTSTILENRIVELAFTPVGELPSQLKHLGLETELFEDGNSIVVYGEIRVGFTQADPISAAVQLSFAIVGMLWPLVMPDLLAKVQKEWKRRSRKTPVLPRLP